MKRKNEGFTLIEVLATVVIISVVLSISFVIYNSIINKSKEKTVSIIKENILAAAELYTKETNDIDNWWGYIDDEKTYRYYCVTIKDLINKGYFDEKINEAEKNTLIKIIKDVKNMTIVKTEIAKETSLENCNKSIQETIINNESDYYKITYYLNNDNDDIIYDTYYKNQEGKYKLRNATYEGFMHSGWYSNKFAGSKIGDIGDEIEITHDLNLYAHWLANPNYKMVNVKLNINGGYLEEDNPEGIYVDNNGFINKVDSNITHIIVYGGTLKNGLSTINNEYINIGKTGYELVEEKEWCRTPTSNGNDCFDKEKSINTNQLCDASNSNCEVILYANWKPTGFDVRFDSRLGLNYAKTWVDKAIVFDGATGWSLGYYDFSVATVYVKFSTNEIGTKQNIIGNQQGAGFGLRIGTNGKLYGELYIDSLNDYITVSSKDALVANKKYTVALTYGTSNLVLYIDGVEEDREPLPTSGSVKQPLTTELMIGCNPNGNTCEGAYFKGKIYSIKVFTKGMSATDINKIDEKDTVYLQLFKEVNVNKKNTNVLRVRRNNGEKLGTLPRAFKIGYQLDGWYTEITGGTKITSEEIVKEPPAGENATTYYAHWIPNNYTIVFEGNDETGGNTESVTCTYDQNCVFPANGYTKTGHSFAGWATSKTGAKVYNNKDTVKNLATKGTITLYAKWTPNKINIKFDVNGGVLAQEHGSTYNINNSLVTKNGNTIIHTMNYGESIGTSGLLNWNNASAFNMTKEGYTINSSSVWCLNSTTCFDQTTNYNSSDFCNANSSDCTAVLTANWYPSLYTISLNNESATTAGTTKIYELYNTKWFLDSAKTNWMKADQNPITIPSKNGYDFKGYYTEEEGKGTQVIKNTGYIVTGNTSVFTSNGTLYAYWSPSVFKISLNNQSASSSGTENVWYIYNTVINSCYYYSNSSVTTCLNSGYIINKPTKNGYNFKGYYTNTGGSGTKYIDSDGAFMNNIYKKLPKDINSSYTDTITLYAYWEKKSSEGGDGGNTGGGNEGGGSTTTPDLSPCVGTPGMKCAGGQGRFNSAGYCCIGDNCCQ